jgi:hypothetical protein
VRAWHHTYGLPTLMTNCSNNYGPYHFPEKLIPLMIINALEGKPLPVYGNGLNVRDWLYVEDHARALTTVFEKGVVGETYNIGGHNEKANIDVVKGICARSTREQIGYVTDRPGHDHRYAIDPSKLERELGWKAQESFDSGIARTVRWYLDNEAWWRPLVEKGCLEARRPEGMSTPSSSRADRVRSARRCGRWRGDRFELVASACRAGPVGSGIDRGDVLRAVDRRRSSMQRRLYGRRQGRERRGRSVACQCDRPGGTRGRGRRRAGIPIVHLSTDYVFDGSPARFLCRGGSGRAGGRLWRIQGRWRAGRPQRQSGHM